MAQRYIPHYMHGPQMGWNSPRLYGGGARWAGGLMGSPFQPPLVIQLQQPAPQQQAIPSPPQEAAAHSAQADEVSRSRAEIVSRARTSDVERQTKRKFRYSGMILTTIASAVISLGLSNIVVTALTVMTSSGDLGCFGPPNPHYSTLGPTSLLMKVFDWSWVSSGLWTALVVFIGGNIIGSVKLLDSVRTRIFSFIALTSLTFLIPASVILSILDTILSDWCKDGNPTKFGTPIAVIVLSAFEFISMTYIVIKLRREIKKSIGGADSSASIETPPAIVSPSPVRSRQDTGFVSNPVTATGGDGGPTREPNVTVINVQPAVQQPSFLPFYGAAAPSPYAVLNRQVPVTRWQPRPVGRPDYLLRGAPGTRTRLFSSNIYPSMVQGVERRPF